MWLARILAGEAELCWVVVGQTCKMSRFLGEIPLPSRSICGREQSGQVVPAEREYSFVAGCYRGYLGHAENVRSHAPEPTILSSSDVASPQTAELRVERKQSRGAAWVVCVWLGVGGCKKRKVRLATLIR